MVIPLRIRVILVVIGAFILVNSLSWINLWWSLSNHRYGFNTSLYISFPIQLLGGWGIGRALDRWTRRRQEAQRKALMDEIEAFRNTLNQRRPNGIN